jgi:hypothetical protein
MLLLSGASGRDVISPKSLVDNLLLTTTSLPPAAAPSVAVGGGRKSGPEDKSNMALVVADIANRFTQFMSENHPQGLDMNSAVDTFRIQEEERMRDHGIYITEDFIRANCKHLVLAVTQNGPVIFTAALRDSFESSLVQRYKAFLQSRVAAFPQVGFFIFFML